MLLTNVLNSEGSISSDSLVFILHNFLQDVDPNDEKLMLLLEGMAEVYNGTVYKVNIYLICR